MTTELKETTKLKDKLMNKFENLFNEIVLKKFYKLSDKQIKALPPHKWTIKNTYQVIDEIEGAKPSLKKTAAIAGAGLLSGALSVGVFATSLLVLAGDLLVGGLITATALTASAIKCGVSTKHRTSNFMDTYKEQIQVGFLARIIPYKGKEVGKKVAVTVKDNAVDVVRTKILKKPSIKPANPVIQDNKPKAIVLGADGKIVIDAASLTVDKSKFYKEQEAKQQIADKKVKIAAENPDLDVKEKAKQRGRAFGKAASLFGKAAKKATQDKITEVKANRAVKKNKGKNL